MLCSSNSRCKNFDLIEIENIFLCKICNAIFHKSLGKIVIPCSKRRLINLKSNIPYCVHCNKLVYV